MTEDLHQTTLEFLKQRFNEEDFTRDDLRGLTERLELSRCSDEDLRLLKDYFYSAIISRRSGNTRIASLEYIQDYTRKLEQQQNQNFTRNLVVQMSNLNNAVDNFNTSVEKHASSSSQQSTKQFWINLLITAVVAFAASGFGARYGASLSTSSLSMDNKTSTINEAHKTLKESK